MGGDASVATPRCTVPARPDVSTPRVTLGCDPLVATQEIQTGGVIRFDCATGVKLGAPLVVSADTVIDGRGVVLDGQDLTQVIRSGNNAQLTLLDVTVTRGAASDFGAGIRLDSGALVSYDSTFSDNHATGSSGGGAIAALPSTATVAVYGGTFTQNTAPNAGAIQAYAGITVMNATFDGNAATGAGGPTGSGGDGGALQIIGPGDSTFCGVTLTGNTAGFTGGALTIISIDSSSVVQMTDVVIDSNVGTGGGGAYLQGLAMLKMQRVSVTSNVATMGGGGGLWLQGPGMLDAENLSVVANRHDGGIGAAMFVDGVTGTVAFSTIADNLGNCPACPAGAIANAATLDYRATVFVDNAAQTSPAACSETGTNSGGTWQWPTDTPACATGVTNTDPVFAPRALATGPAGTLFVRRPSAGSPVTAAFATGCPGEDVLGNPRPSPCAGGAVEPP